MIPTFRKIARAGFLLLAILNLIGSPARTGGIDVDASRYLDEVRYLSSKDMRGRATGSPELDKAAKYIANEFHKSGLKPVYGKSFYQDFTVSVNSSLGPHNSLAYTSNGTEYETVLGKDFTPFNFSASGSVKAPVVFAGYGITAREYNYDDYAGIDVKDKFVLVLRHEPQETDAKSVFAAACIPSMRNCSARRRTQDARRARDHSRERYGRTTPATTTRSKSSAKTSARPVPASRFYRFAPPSREMVTAAGKNFERLRAPSTRI